MLFILLRRSELLAVFAFSALILSCGRENVTVSKVTLIGKVQAGPVSFAQVKISELNQDGTVKKVLKTTSTDFEGYFTEEIANIAPNTHLLAEASGGSYLDEASQQIIALGPEEGFRSIILVDGPSINVPITPLTDMVAIGAMENEKAARNLSEAVDSFSALVEFYTGLSENDLKHLPQSPNGLLTAATPEERLDAALTGLSSVLGKLEVAPSKKNAAYSKISRQLAKNGRLELLLEKEMGFEPESRMVAAMANTTTTKTELTAQPLVSQLDSFYAQQEIPMVPFDLDANKLKFLKSSCGAPDSPLAPGQVCCEEGGCAGACVYKQDPQKGETCDEEEEEEEEENCQRECFESLLEEHKENEGLLLASALALAVTATENTPTSNANLAASGIKKMQDSLPDAEELASEMFKKMQDYLKSKGRAVDEKGVYIMLQEDLDHFRTWYKEEGIACRYNGNPGNLKIEGPHPECKTPHGHQSFCQKGPNNKPKHLPKGGKSGHRLPVGPKVCSTPFGAIDFLFELSGAVRLQRELKEEGINATYFECLFDTWNRPIGYYDPETGGIYGRGGCTPTAIGY